MPGNALRRAGSDDFTAPVSAFGAEVDNPVRGLDDIQVMFDHDDGIAVIAQLVQHPQQLFYVMEMQTRSGFIQYVQGLAGVALG